MPGTLGVSALYRRVRVLRWALPLAVFLIAAATEAHEYFESGRRINGDTLIFGVVVPALIWAVCTGLDMGLRQRDAAQARLRILYNISSEVAGAPDVAALVEIAANMLGRLLGPVPVSLMMRERDASPWTLADARHLLPAQERALNGSILQGRVALPCARCPRVPGALVRDCELLAALESHGEPPPGRMPARAVICLPLAGQERFDALITAYVDRAAPGMDDLRPLLASLGDGFATALERARLRARELEVLQRMELAARRAEALPEVLYSILGDVAGVHEARSSLVYVIPPESHGAQLSLLCAWPAGQPAPDLAELARRALEGGSLVEEPLPPGRCAVAVPLIAKGARVGALVLSGRPAANALNAVTLRVAAELTALVVRNSQLTAELEGRAILEERNRLAGEVHDRVAQGLGYLNLKVQQIDRLLQEGRPDAGRQELRELRKEVLGLYSEVRLTIDDLRWPLDGGEGLAARLEKYCRDVSERLGSARSGLAISVSVESRLALAPSVEVQLVRIIQEALINIDRHAAARHAWVRLVTAEGRLCLTVEDDGEGFSPELEGRPGHFGLAIMRERTAAMGGVLSVTGGPGRGARLEISVPMEGHFVRQNSAADR